MTDIPVEIQTQKNRGGIYRMANENHNPLGRIPDDIKQQIMKNKLALWRNTEYDAQLDVEIALDILTILETAADSRNQAQVANTEQMKTQATQRMKNAKRVIAVLERKLSELERKDDGQ